MKKLVLSTAAISVLAISAGFAADLPMKAPPQPAAPIFNWSGFYIGGTAGGAWGDPKLEESSGRTMTVSVDGGVFGGEAGYNWQAGNFVYGIEADIQNGPKGTNPLGTTSSVVGGAAFVCGGGKCRIDTSYFGTVRGRLGIANNQWLLYGTGGWAYGSTKEGLGNGIDNGTDHPSGWAAGGGVEYALSPNWSLKIEYLHIDLGKANAGPAPFGAAFSFNAVDRFDVVRAGLNWKFGSFGG